MTAAFAERSGRVPVALLTGFLGSGKTTLLNRLLRHPDMARTAVVINEFGEIPLDQHLVERVDSETVVLANGCLCCSVQDDIESVIGTLFTRRGRGEVPGFERMLIETSGLADPAPIMQMLLGQPLVIPHFRLDTVITTVDAVQGERQLTEHKEAFKQAALADRLVLTKADLAASAESVTRLEARLRAINPDAAHWRSGEHIGPGQLFGDGLNRSLRMRSSELAGHTHGDGVTHDHSDGVATFALSTAEPLRWADLNRWLTGLRIRHAERLLRVKGIVRLAGERAPVAIHGVHHVFHPPEPLPHLAADAAFGDSQLVFITRHLAAEEVQSSWRAFLDKHRADARPREHHQPNAS